MLREEHVVAYDASHNGFYWNPALHRVADRLGREGGNLSRVLQEGGGLEVVSAAKHDGTRRLGAHLHPREVATLSRVACEIAPIVRTRQSRVRPNKRVAFSHQIRDSFDRVPERGMFRVDAWNRMAAAVRSGYKTDWSAGTLDIRNFYPSVSPDAVASAMAESEMPSAAIDEICMIIDKHGVGLLQGYTASDVISHVVLMPAYDEIARWGLRVAAYSDDFRILGPTAFEVGRDTAILAEILESHGFGYAPSKQRVYSGCEAAFLARLAVDVRSVPVSDYVQNADGLDGAPVLGDGYPASDGRWRLATDSDMGWILLTKLYEDEFAPGRPARSEQLFRWCIRHLAERWRPMLIHDFMELVRDPNRSWSVEELLKTVKPAEHAAELQALCEEVAPTDPHMAASILRYSANWGVKQAAAAAASILRSGAATPALRAACYAVIGENGNPTQMVRCAMQWSTETWPDQQVAIVGALERMPKVDRGRHYDEFAQDSELARIAVKYYKN